MAHVDDQGAQVYAARAYEGALSAQHALAEFFGETVILSPTECVVDFADVKVGELSCRASGGTPAAADALAIGWDFLQKAVRLSQIRLAQVERTCLLY